MLARFSAAPSLALVALLAAVGPVAAQQPAPPQQQQQQRPPAAPAQARPPAAPAPAPAVRDPVVATVNGVQVRLSEIEVAHQSLPPQYRALPMEQVFSALLERLIDAKLVVQEGRRNKVQDDAAFKKRMAFVEEQVTQDFWIQREVTQKATPERLRALYEERLKTIPAEEEVRARHILVATEDEAKAVLADLKKGVPFDKIAREKSTDKASGAEGGDLGWFKKADMVKEFADAAFALKRGALSDAPIRTQFGFHVILLEDRRQTPPPAFEELVDQIRDTVAREAVGAMLDRLRAGAKVEKFNIDGSKPGPAAPR